MRTDKDGTPPHIANVSLRGTMEIFVSDSSATKLKLNGQHSHLNYPTPNMISSSGSFSGTASTMRTSRHCYVTENIQAITQDKNALVTNKVTIK